MKSRSHESDSHARQRLHGKALEHGDVGMPAAHEHQVLRLVSRAHVGRCFKFAGCNVSKDILELQCTPPLQSPAKLFMPKRQLPASCTVGLRPACHASAGGTSASPLKPGLDQAPHHKSSMPFHCSFAMASRCQLPLSAGLAVAAAAKPCLVPRDVDRAISHDKLLMLPHNKPETQAPPATAP